MKSVIQRVSYAKVTVDGEITATDVKTDTNISLKSHKHLGVRAGSDTSGLPTM